MKIVIRPYNEGVYLFNLYDKLDKKYNLEDKPILNMVIEKSIDVLQFILNYTYNPVYKLIKRKDKIRIDNYDTWNLDQTLAKIILPCLIQLKNTKHGSPQMEESDIPDEQKHLDIHARWDWAMDEMIFAFTCINNPDKDIFEFNENEYKRIQNGLRLFGIYYLSLWD